jgi:hypothetical protein
LLASTTALTGCKKIAEEVFSGFDLPLNGIPTVIPPFPISYYPISVANTYKFNLDSLVKSESRGAFAAKDLKSVKVKQATLHLLNADSATTLATLHAVSLKLYSDTIRNPITLVSAGVPDTATNVLHFDAWDSPEILAYLQGRTITYVVSVQLREPTRNSLVLSTDMTFRIE